MTEEERYILDHTSPQGEALAWLERQTNIRTNFPQMLAGPVQGRFLKMLVEASGARNILEIGCFTGYSSIWLASGLPSGGHLDTLEINDELEDLIREGFRRSGLGDRISLHIGDALDTLKELTGPYDFVFMDADKREYCSYYEAVLPLVRPGGLILADDTLWGGKLWEDPLPADRQTRGVAAFNDMAAGDPTVEVVLLPLRHGLSLIRKKS